MDASLIERRLPSSTAEIAQLEAHVRSQLIGRIRHFHIIVRDEGLVLKGLASTYYAKQLAQHAVMQGSKVPILANDIMVAGAVGR